MNILHSTFVFPRLRRHAAACDEEDQRGECQREQDIGQRIEGERTVRNETVKKIIQEVEHQDSQYGEQQIADDSLDHSGMHSFLCLYHTTDFVERKEFYFKSSVTQAA